jgi:hypothetical protein
MRRDWKNINRVKLNIDLTRIHAKCVKGSTGYTDPNIRVTESPIKDRPPDNFIWVVFDNGAMLKVLWGCLEQQMLDGSWGH